MSEKTKFTSTKTVMDANKRLGQAVDESEVNELLAGTSHGAAPGMDFGRIDPVGGVGYGAPVRRSSPLRIVFLISILLVALYYFGLSNVQRDGVKVAEHMATSKQDFRFMGINPSEIADTYLEVLNGADDLFKYDIPKFLDGAESRLNIAIEIDERRVEAFAKLALVLSRRYLYGTANDRPQIFERLKACLNSGREIDPQHTAFYVAEGEVALSNGDYELAKRLANFALETSPNGFLGQQLKIGIAIATGNQANLREKLSALTVPTSHKIRIESWVAAVQVKAGSLSEARSTLLNVLQDDPLHIPSYLLLAEVFVAQKELANARNAFETAGRLGRLDGGLTSAHSFLRLGETEKQLKNLPASEKAFRLSYYFGASTEEIHKRQKTIELDSGSIRIEAERELYDSQYFADQGKVLLSEKNVEAAMLFFLAANQLDPNNPEYLLKLGSASEKAANSQGQFQRAISYYERAIVKSPDNVEAYIRLGLLETDHYNFDKAFEVLQQAAVLSPEAIEPMIALGKHYYKRQDYQASLEQFLKAKRLAPDNSEILYYAGLLITRFSKEQMREAMALFYRAYTLDPQNHDALTEWLKLKVVYYEKNFALKFMESLIEQNPRDSHYRGAMGEIYAANNEYNRAIRYYHQALDLDNRNGRVRLSLARALKVIGEIEAAVEEFRLASRLDFRNGEGYFQASELNLEAKNYVGAERDIAALLRALPQFPGGRRQLSKLNYFKGNKEAAVGEMRKEVDANPLNTKFRQELAELLFGYGRFDEAALELSQITNLPSRSKAPEFTKDKTRAFLWLSRTHRASSRFESAEGAIRLALDLDPNDPDLIREKGFVYQGQRRDKEAAAVFEDYLKRNPAAVDAEQIKKIISDLIIEE